MPSLAPLTIRTAGGVALAALLALSMAACRDGTRNPAPPPEQKAGDQTGGTKPVSPPAEAGEMEADEQDSIVVTGSRIRRSMDRSEAPITSLGGTNSASPAYSYAPTPESIAPPPPPIIDRERYEDVDPNAVVSVADEPVSTFSVDVDTASYAIMRRYLNDGSLPPRDAVRIEEMINYFDYDYPLPESREEPFAMALEVTPTPWNSDTQLLRIGLQGYELADTETKPLNLVLLLDVSGSMNSPDKLPLLKKALGLLIDTMTGKDRISIAVYAGAAGVILEPTSGSEKGKILAALDSLSAGGSTAGGEGIRLAYSLAERNLDPERINRVLLATDGDFNVGITDPEKLEDFVARKRDTGIYLTVLGFGRGNLNDAMMQKLVQAGNGQAAYIDTLREARKVLVDGVRATLFPIAKDVKIQVEFNPARVAEYRLIGYETRLLERSDFNNDKVDAGEVGSGHSVTAIYEITSTDSEGRLIDDLRYGGEDEEQPAPAASDKADEIAFVRLRYKLPEESESRLMETPVTDDMVAAQFEEASQEARFAVAVAGFGQLMRGDPNLKAISLEDLLTIALNAKGADPYGYRAELTQLMRLAQSASALDTNLVPPRP